MRRAAPARALIACCALAGGATAIAGEAAPFAAPSPDAPAVADAARALWPAALTDLDGRPFALAALRGRPLLVNFWARWCVPCRREIPELLAARTHAPGDALIVGIAIDDNLAGVREFAAAYHMDYRVLVGGEEGIRLLQSLGDQAASLPFTLLVDRSGAVIGTKMGAMDSAEIDAALRRAADVPAEPPLEASSAADARASSIAQLGALTGEALGCDDQDAVRYAKTLMLSYVPKSQRYGQLYEEATRRGYLAWVTARATCAGESALLTRIDSVGTALRQLQSPARVPTEGSR